MAVGFGSFEIARSGMAVSERSLSITGHNISNVNTTGYVRQQAMITTSQWQNIQDINGSYQLGTGADIGQIRQLRNSFLDNIYRQEVTTEGYWESRNKTFQDVQTILGEPMNTGLQSSVNEFWDSWQELSKAPDSLTARALVKQRGNGLIDQVNHIGTQIDKLQSDLNSELKVRIIEVNQITEALAKVNLKILKTEVSKDTANDYRDQRNVLLDRLSKLLDVDVSEMQDGQVDVTLGGYFLVSKGNSFNLIAEEAKKGDIFCVPKLESNNTIVPIKNGIIKGLMEARGEVSGVTDSQENGTPNVKSDITFAIDTSDTSTGYLAKVQASAQKYVDELKKSGLDYNLRLVTYDGAVKSNINYGADATAFVNDISLLTTSTNTNNDFGNVVTELTNTTNFREDANKYMLVFTNESINGDEVVADVTDVAGYVDNLNALGIKTSIITSTTNNNSGLPLGETDGWGSITKATSGNLYDINSTDYDSLMTKINSSISKDINMKVSIVNDSNNILSDLRKRINAEINTIMRETNYLHCSGKTLSNPPSDGQDFFVTINNEYPLQMGNIKLNDNLEDLDNIVASESGADGDNGIAIKIADLRHMPVLSDTNGVMGTDDYYQSIILSIGTGGSEAERIYENQKTLVNSADTQRKAIMNVSMDEEMSNMMKYKFAYSASSRVINTLDSMLDTIINKLGTR